MSDDLAGPDEWGVQRYWLDAHDRPHRVPDETVTLLREVVGRPPADLEERAPIVTRPGRDLGLGPVEVVGEDGTAYSLNGVVPDDFPLGYHRLRTTSGVERRLIVSPGRCWLPEERWWGWTVQLYAARSRSSQGIGDLGDLRTLREWTEETGGGFLLVNPLHAVAPTLPQEASPYLPATRRFRNPIYLSVDGLVADQGSGLIDRDAVWTAKRAALRRQFDPGPEGFAPWRREQGAALERFATWCALAEEHGPDWREWPAGLHDPDGSEVAAYALGHRDEIGFHAWLQWLLDEQLRAATGSTKVIQDLPIGVSGGGADAWEWQDVLAGGITVGAPPDMLNTTGQDWGSPPLVPWRLRATDYEPFVQSVRATIAGAGGLRIDHVMGLFRLWWIPDGAAPTAGAYVHYPADDLLDIVALESHRASAIVIGEDLGTVEPAVREALADRGILSYKLLWFEDDQPAEWPSGALGAVSTHDLPTVAGLWTGSDVEDQLASTTMPEAGVRSGSEELLGRLRRGGLERSASAGDAVTAAYEQLAEAPCLLLSLSLEDALLEERRPNIPGTTERVNWRIPLPVPLEEVVTSPAVARLARLVDESLRPPSCC